MENWKAIPNFSRYEASDYGRLRSLNYKCSGRIVVLKPAIAKDGYAQTMLQGDNGKYYSYKVHKFVAITFLGNEYPELEINHKDGVKTNNYLSNLEYMTRSENVQHSFDNGLQVSLKGSKNPASKLTEQDVKDIRQHVANFEGRYYGRKELALKYGVTECCIKDIVSRRRNSWSHI